MTYYVTKLLLHFLSFTVFEIVDFTKFVGFDLDLWRSPVIKIFLPFESPYMISYLTSNDTFLSISYFLYNLIPFLRNLTSKFLGFDFDL